MKPAVRIPSTRVGPAFLVLCGLSAAGSLALAEYTSLREASTVTLFIPLVWSYLLLSPVVMALTGLSVVLLRIAVELRIATFAGIEDTWAQVAGEVGFAVLLYVALGLVCFVWRARLGRLENRCQENTDRRTEVRLLQGLTHDFNNLMHLIIGTTQLLRGRATLEPNVVEQVETIHNAAQGGADLLRRIQAISDPESGEPSPWDMNEYARDRLSLLRYTASEDVSVQFEPAEELLPVLMDPVQFDRLLMNLCVNADQAMGGHGSLTVKTGLDSSGFVPGVTLRVEDSGPGIPPNTLPYIFRRYFTTRSRQGGTGLGLYNVRAIVEAHGGTVEAENRKGEGTAFVVWLPLYEARANPEKDEQVA